jgi:hypothetical protein
MIMQVHLLGKRAGRILEMSGRACSRQRFWRIRAERTATGPQTVDRFESKWSGALDENRTRDLFFTKEEVFLRLKWPRLNSAESHPSPHMLPN